mmetsp:Transcript_63715/g.136982  ORF Transcript_63715/g.136982 Transcript_63715/m.136982 type:complete len:123 (-) Transcript_63715:493-861(-)
MPSCSSLLLIVPSPSVSNRRKTSFISNSVGLQLIKPLRLNAELTVTILFFGFHDPKRHCRSNTVKTSQNEGVIVLGSNLVLKPSANKVWYRMRQLNSITTQSMINQTNKPPHDNPFMNPIKT